MEVEELTIVDLRRTLELLRRYEDSRIGFVDATVVAIAERLNIQRILTTDRRDFSLIRPRHCKEFLLLPYGKAGYGFHIDQATASAKRQASDFSDGVKEHAISIFGSHQR